LKVDIFWRHFLLNEIACFVQNDVVSFTVHLKKTESSKRCCFEWVHLLLPWTCYKQGKKKIIPLQHLSLSLSLSLSLYNINLKIDKTHGLPLDEKTEETSFKGGCPVATRPPYPCVMNGQRVE
jgi:hypothetical protein